MPDPAKPSLPQPLFWLFLCAILALAAVLRFHHLSHSLWIDELRSMIDIAKSKEHLWKLFHPPTYYVAMRWLTAWAGFEVEAMRGLSAAFGCGSLIFFALAMRRFGQLPCLLAVLILACNPLHLQYSLEIRNYSLSLFVFSVAMYMATWIGAKRHLDIRPIVLFGLVCAILPTINRAGFFLFFVLWVFLLVMRPEMTLLLRSRCHRRAVVGSLLVLVGAFSAYEYFLRGDTNSLNARIPMYINSDPFRILRETAEVLGLDEIVHRLSILLQSTALTEPQILATSLVVTIALVFAALWGAKLKWRHPLLITAATYWLALGLFSIFIRSVWIDRVLLAGLIPFAGWYAWCVCQSQGWRRRMALTAMLTLCSLWATHWVTYSSVVGRENWRHVADELARLRHPGETAYILHRTNVLRFYGAEHLRRFFLDRGIERLPEFARDRDRLFVVYRRRESTNARTQQIRDYVCQSYPVCESTGKTIVLLVGSQSGVGLAPSQEDFYVHQSEISRQIREWLGVPESQIRLQGTPVSISAPDHPVHSTLF